MHTLGEGDSTSESTNVIHKYYASKPKKRAKEATQESRHIPKDSPKHQETKVISTKSTNAITRNSILFPNMTQTEIDARILEVCEKR